MATVALVVLGVAAVGLSLALALRSEGIDERTETARAAFASSDVSSALAATEEAVRMGANDAETLRLLGTAREANGDVTGAEEAYRRSLDTDPEQPEVLHSIAALAFARGDEKAAEKALRSALEVDGGLVGSRILLGDVLASAGDPAGARREYETVLKSDAPGVDEASVRAKLEALR